VTACRISDLVVFPVKSCCGIRLTEARVRARGFAHDRRWMVVDGGGEFLSQRGFPALARVRVALEDEGLRLDAPAMPPLTVTPSGNGKRRMVRVWDDEVEAECAGAEAATWFSSFLDAPCELVRLGAAGSRPVDPRYGRPGEQTSFADGFPYLLASDASLEDLNRRLDRPVPMARFRPNIVVTGCPPFAEDSWSALTFGEVRFRVVKPCARCVVVNTDQLTGERDAEPLRTLASFRRHDKQVLFAQNLVAETEGTLRVGDVGHAEQRP
jgi:uncharacterized protein